MKQKPAKSAVIEFGYLVKAEDMFYPWKFYCFHCSCPVELIHAQGDQPSHFIHDLEQLTDTARAICPNIDRSNPA